VEQTVPSILKIVTRYHAHSNEYSVYRHNLTMEEANDAVQEIAARRFGIFILDQQKPHSTAKANRCTACRREVETLSHVTPKPTPKRRRK
jgi:hypothetical protein